jgi:RHS repeat-associated protein
MTYDAAGNVVSAVKPSGAATVDLGDGTATYAYDVANRLIETSFSDDTAGFTYSYTDAGRLDSAARIQGGNQLTSSAYTYDGSGRVTSAVATGPGGGTTNYAYSSAGRLTGAAWSTGMSAAYTYNQVGQLVSLESSGTGAVPAVTYGYDAAGNLTAVTRGTDTPTSTTYSYDAANQLAALIQAAGSSSQTTYGITRDVNGNPTQVATTTGGTTTTALYGFDTANRLKSECYPTSGVMCTGKSPRSTYAYNAVGNRTSKSDRTVVGTVATTVTTASTYDVADQLLTQAVGGAVTVTNTWSVNGTLATSTSSAGTRTFTSDLTDELTTVVLENGSTVGYTTDTHGNRTSRSVNGQLDATWAWDQIAQLPTRVGEYGATGNLSTAWLTDPVSATGAPLAQTNGTTASWLLTDWASNVTAAVSTTGTTVTGTNTLDVFGNNRATGTGSLTSAAFAFSGQYLDSVTGLYDMRARDYDTTTGRFTAQDPVATPTGMPYFASYVYGYNNPLMFVDPSGQWSWDEWKGFLSWDSSTTNAVWEGVEDIGTWSAAFGDTVTFGGTGQVRRLISYEGGDGDSDMVDHDSVFYEWGGHGGDVVNFGLMFIGGVGAFKAVYGRLEASVNAFTRVEATADCAFAADGAASTTANALKNGGAPPIRNASLAGDTHPSTGVPFDDSGFPDFAAFRHPSVPDVRITPTGTRAGDFAAANKAAGLARTPTGYTWHHNQELGVMQLVERNVHAATGHTGGFAIWGRTK